MHLCVESENSQNHICQNTKVAGDYFSAAFCAIKGDSALCI